MATTLCTCAALGLRTDATSAPSATTTTATLIRDELTRRGVDVAHAGDARRDNAFAVILLDDAARRARRPVGPRPARWTWSPRRSTRRVIRGARLVHVDDVDEEAAIRAAPIARDAGHPGDERHRARRRADRRSSSPRSRSRSSPSTCRGADRRARSRARAAAGCGGRTTTAWLCVTLGARGAMLLDGDRLYRVAGVPVDVVDTHRRRRRLPRRVHRRAAARRRARRTSCASPTPPRRSAARGRARSAACRRWRRSRRCSATTKARRHRQATKVTIPQHECIRDLRRPS